MVETIVIAIIGSGALSTLISAVVQAIANRKSRLTKIEQKLDEIENNQRAAEKDVLRTQLILMIADYPDEKTDILRLAEYYFSKLEGNWVAGAIFSKWLIQHDIPRPEWYKEGR